MKMQMYEVLKSLPGIGELTRSVAIESLGFASHVRSRMLVFAESKKFYRVAARNPQVACIITTAELANSGDANLPHLITQVPRAAFYTIHKYLASKTNFYWNDFPSEISPDAQIHPAAIVAPRNVRIGPGSVIEPGATILERSVIGQEVVIRAGATIGSQGFQFERIGERILAVPHGGGVRLCDRVEIQANCTIDLAVFGGFTEIGEDTKLDNLIHVAHAVQIGKRCLIAASAMIAGSTFVGDDVWIGPGARVSDHLTIGSGARITLGAVVVRDVKPGQCVSGNFAVEHSRFMEHFRVNLRQ